MNEVKVNPPMALVVDDDEAARRLVARLLTKKGFRCSTAGDAGEALAYTRAAHYDIVVTDMHMSMMSGLDLVAKLATERPRTATVMLTCDSSSELRDRAREAGVDNFFVKGPGMVDLTGGVYSTLADKLIDIAAADGSSCEEPSTASA